MDAMTTSVLKVLGPQRFVREPKKGMAVDPYRSFLRYPTQQQTESDYRFPANDGDILYAVPETTMRFPKRLDLPRKGLGTTRLQVVRK